MALPCDEGHVGARYYDPSSGRFLQRDPIGIEGGANVYAYVRNGPALRVDPPGLFDTKPCYGYCAGKHAKCKQKNKPSAIMCGGNKNECDKNCSNKANEVISGNSSDPGPPPYPNPTDPDHWDPWPNVAVEEKDCGPGAGGAASGTLFTLFGVRFWRRRNPRGHG